MPNSDPESTLQCKRVLPEWEVSNTRHEYFLLDLVLVVGSQFTGRGLVRFGNLL